MKYWFIGVLVALLVTSVQAGKGDKAEGKKKSESALVGDKDGDGKISEKEFIAIEKSKAKKSGEEFDEEAASEKFTSLDTDEDGFLSESEMGSPKKDSKEDDSGDEN